ncbi:MAG: DNA topoisomerase 1 [Spirochaetes bacterium ADurb.Bin315]|nr:MAG: DNA topoisomerase 1 [Spirochaetes bacterium ADurb.Bin315]
MSEKNTLIIVESPTKAKTITKFLPKTYKVVASNGHVRDLPEERMAIKIEKGFAAEYEPVKGKQRLIADLKKELKDADRLLLATDEDREGESISWHLLEVLKPKIPYRRMVFHEITKKAITNALETGRDLDENLVHAQEGRRLVDRLYGYTLSPTLWKKLSNKKLSAGRVQSVGLRLTVDRERMRIAFEQNTYWDASAELTNAKGELFEAKLVSYQDRAIASSRDFDATTGAYKGKMGMLHLGEEEARAIVKELKEEQFVVTSIERKPFITRPSIPFTTSTLQQDATRKLRISASEVMRIAQRLYESGYITYMRTDSPSLSREGTMAARAQVEELYGTEYLSPKARYFAAKSAQAQEAHEAIRPAGDAFVHPQDTRLSGRELALYDLIWKRTLACQMADAQKATTTATIEAGAGIFTATGTEIVFPGFIRAYVEEVEDNEIDKDKILPPLSEGEVCPLKSLTAVEHQTRLPARYTEASLVQELEKRGIGRPSTYATIIKTLLDRKYVVKEGSALVPTFIGFGVCQFLETNFKQFIDYDFTVRMEEDLDKIARGELKKETFLAEFFLGEHGLMEQNRQQLTLDNKGESKTLNLCHIDEANPIMIGPYGPYVVLKDGQLVSLPYGWTPGSITDADVKALIANGKQQPEAKTLGPGPNTGEPIQLLSGRFGPYWQEGEGKDAKRASVPKWVQDGDLQEDGAIATRYLSLPRILGKDKEGMEVVATKGKYGPYLASGDKTRKLNRLDKDKQLFGITLEEALELLGKEEVKGSKKRGVRTASAPLKELGEFEGRKITLHNGRYGFYLKHGTSNVTLPNEYKKDEEKALSLRPEEAQRIVEEKQST